MSQKKIKLFSDGCARGNPGPAGAGFVIFEMNGSELESGSKFLGNNETNNTAEYKALILGLTACITHTKGIVSVYSDSELMVKQLNGDYRINKTHLKKLADEVVFLITKFQKVSFHHIRREKNTRADELANQAVDQALKT